MVSDVGIASITLQDFPDRAEVIATFLHVELLRIGLSGGGAGVVREDFARDLACNRLDIMEEKEI
jgi:hypothetical protein